MDRHLDQSLIVFTVPPILPLVVDSVTHGILKRCYHTAWICISFHIRIFFVKLSDIRDASSNLETFLFCVSTSVSILISAFLLINPEYLPQRRNAPEWPFCPQ